ncbi:MAG: TetR/AcrR family transcriptional regulator [Treponema sp.]|nr:TetR/AcrR family transcriptional regulator [Treponema sp.]
MDRKIDRRTRYTQSVIKKIFIELLREKPIEKITVTEICKTAEINRGTFYTHFNDPYDLLRQIEMEHGDRMVASLERMLPENGESVFDMDLAALIHKTIRDDATLQFLASTRPSSTNILQRLFEGLASILKPRLVDKYGFSEEEAHAIYTFLFSGYHAMDSYFMNRKTAPEKVEKIKKIVNGIVRRGFPSRKA